MPSSAPSVEREFAGHLDKPTYERGHLSGLGPKVVLPVGRW